MIWIKRLLLLIVVIVVGTTIIMAFLPKPILVDFETVQSGPMRVTVRDDGRTRIRERYVISTPISGRMRRIELNVGDLVTTGETVVATIEPTSPTLLDPRARAQAEARVRTAEGRLSRANAEAEQVQIELDQAISEFTRESKLRQQGATSTSAFENAQSRKEVLAKALESATFAKEIAEYELQLEKAGLLHVSQIEDRENQTDDAQNGDEFVIKSPISGRVLSVLQESSAVVLSGAPLLEVGDPLDLEVVVDVLSSDAVRILPGQAVTFEQWGGSEPLAGIVRLVEPSGFTKISALGVEEQRVNIVIDFVGSMSERLSLGDGYRVEAGIVVWESEETISIPTGSLFRSGKQWAVFLIQQNVAHLQFVDVGESNGLRVQILKGLAEGDEIVMYPSDELTDGCEIERRQ